MFLQVAAARGRFKTNKSIDNKNVPRGDKKELILNSCTAEELRS
jgi:hypothetical protein